MTSGSVVYRSHTHTHVTSLWHSLFRIKNSIPDLSLEYFISTHIQINASNNYLWWRCQWCIEMDRCVMMWFYTQVDQWAVWDWKWTDEGWKGARLYYSTLPFRDGASGSFFKWTPFNAPQQIDLIDFPPAPWLYGLSVNILQPAQNALCLLQWLFKCQLKQMNRAEMKPVCTSHKTFQWCTISLNY